MGTPKMLLPWKDTSILGQLIRQWGEIGAAQIVVVIAPSQTALHEELDRLGFPSDCRIINPSPERGMFSSIQCAAQWPEWQNGTERVALALGDQPHLRIETLCLLAWSECPSILQPSFKGRPRHPVFFSKKIFDQLAPDRLMGPRVSTLKEFIARHSSRLIEMDDPGLDLDIDRPADYQRAVEL
jgi:molybdenum cofactor cytidylyltransferase